MAARASVFRRPDVVRPLSIGVGSPGKCRRVRNRPFKSKLIASPRDVDGERRHAEEGNQQKSKEDEDLTALAIAAHREGSIRN
jgi:hypothetical protein